MVYGLKCCRMFVLGCPNLLVAVDHKPLVKIFNDRQLDTIDNPRIFSLKEKAMLYQFDIMHVAGTANYTADATSRHPAQCDDDDPEYHNEEASIAHASLQGDGIEAVTWSRVNEVAACDEECLMLAKTIIEGFPATRDELPPKLRYFWPMRDEMYTIENVPFKGNKMLIPSDLRGRVLEGLHAAHQGVTGMLSNARSRFFWPGLDAAIRQLRSRCRQCNENAPSQSVEAMILSPSPEFPFQQVVTDFAEIEGHDFLVYADRYSGWLEVAKLGNKTWKTVRQIFLTWFTTFGVPEEISCDGGPPFNSAAFNDFLDRWEVRKRQSSAYYAQSNGRAESAVKSAKRILLGNINKVNGQLDTEAAAQAMMTYRNTPLQDTEISPATTLYGRPIRDHLPCKRLEVRAEWQTVADAREAAFAKRQLRSDPRVTDKVLEPLSDGDAVQLQNQKGNRPLKWYATGIVVERLPNRQYKVLVDGSRRITLRNRKFIRKIDPVCRRQWKAPSVNDVEGLRAPLSQLPVSNSPRTPVALDPSPWAVSETEKSPTAAHVEEAEHNSSPHAGQNCGPETAINDTPKLPNDAMQRVSRRMVRFADANENLHIVQDDGMSETENILPRRSRRQRTAPVPFSPKLHGQSHI